MHNSEKAACNFSARNFGAGYGCANLWAPGVFWFFLLENPRAHKIPPFRGEGLGFSWKGELEVPLSFLWARGFFRIILQGFKIHRKEGLSHEITHENVIIMTLQKSYCRIIVRT